MTKYDILGQYRKLNNKLKFKKWATVEADSQKDDIIEFLARIKADNNQYNNFKAEFEFPKDVRYSDFHKLIAVVQNNYTKTSAKANDIWNVVEEKSQKIVHGDVV